MNKINLHGVVGELNILPEVITAFTQGTQGGIYIVTYAGYAENLKEFHVQINSGGNGFASDWPEWAYNLAKEALVSNKKLWVISNGIPYGKNLLQILIYNF